MTKDKKADKSATNKAVCVTVAIAVVTVVLLVGWFSGLLPYWTTYARCLQQPITATRFSSSNYYSTPGQSGYGINPIAKYYCTEQEAKEAGFHKRGDN